ncbi:unnamed protein product [Rotaria magnacalcarata]|uniref:Uncharacterized protein n=1 Tax=Rotaria magnacalcarata TaxID=392030 RepID=A0A815Z3N8_9BILA|nr:unnamed protein product [Rotaria magnacalcarata]CAF3811603.1 unnamed protein product [Rotaria magnacalcarata]CAF3824333.1 unnamed protein product [Rotaria magnacalcarata]CAF3866876.1 unnamed protein product [Rotaria magnacalcarata]
MYVYRLFSNGKAEFIDKQQDLLDSIQIIHEKSKTIFVPTPISYDFPRYAIYDIMTEVEKANILLQKHSTTGVNLYGIIKDLLCKLSNRLRDDYFDAKVMGLLGTIQDSNEVDDLKNHLDCLFVQSSHILKIIFEVNIQKLEWRNIERCAACIDPKEINKDLLYNQFND